jgi:hypothetical protein
MLWRVTGAAVGVGHEGSKRNMRSSKARNDVKASEPRAARTLAELGVPELLARELEGALRALGEVEDGLVRGRRFSTPDGTWHEVRVGEEEAA